MQQLPPKREEETAEPRLLEKEPAMAEPAAANEAAAEGIEEDKVGGERVGFLKARERKLLSKEKGKGEREREGLPRVQRTGPEGLLRNSFCITSEHFKNPFRPSLLFGP